MNVTVIIQARMGSTRLPGKVMKMLRDRTVLGHVITRCKAIASVNQVILATTILEEDDVLVEEALNYKVGVFRGSVDNVLSRYYEAAKKANSDIVVRITADCPLIDPIVSNEVIKFFLSNNYDYVSSGLSGTFPRGLDTEVFTFKALEKSYKEASMDFEFEHVTPYIYRNLDLFKVYAYRNYSNQSNYRLTLDTEEDFQLISKVYEELYKGGIFFVKDILALFERNPGLALLNAEVKQKKLGE